MELELHMMYLKVKEMMPKPNGSIYAIAYTLLGRCAIFVVALVQFLNCIAVMILYYIVIGDTLS